jgi:hypothetical protein
MMDAIDTKQHCYGRHTLRPLVRPTVSASVLISRRVYSRAAASCPLVSAFCCSRCTLLYRFI